MLGNNSVRSSHNIPVSVLPAQISGLQRNTLLPLLLDQDVSTSSTSSGLSSEAWDQPSSAVILCSKHKGGLSVSIYILQQSEDSQCNVPLFYFAKRQTCLTLSAWCRSSMSAPVIKLSCGVSRPCCSLYCVYCTVLFHQPITSSLSPMPPVMNDINTLAC